MNAAIYIFLPVATDLNPFNFEVPQFEWQGVLYPQGPPACAFGTNFLLKEKQDFNHFNKNTWPAYYQSVKLKCIEILGNGLDMYVASLYLDAKEETGFTLSDLINALLCNTSRWIIIYDYEYDGYEWKVESSIQDALAHLEWAVRSREGLLIYG